MSDGLDPRVDDYIRALPGWQADLCRRLRDLVHAADPDVTETVKRKGQPYFVLEGNVCALLAAKDHVNLFTYDGRSCPTPRHHHRRSRQQHRPDHRLPRRRPDPGTTADRDAPTDHREQQGRRLACPQSGRSRPRAGPGLTRSTPPTSHGTADLRDLEVELARSGHCLPQDSMSPSEEERAHSGRRIDPAVTTLEPVVRVQRVSGDPNGPRGRPT